MKEVCKYIVVDTTQKHLFAPFKRVNPHVHAVLLCSTICFPDEHNNMQKGSRAVIPKTLRSEYFAVLHKELRGLEATKDGQETGFWPSISDDTVQASIVCNSQQLHQPEQQLKVYQLLTSTILWFILPQMLCCHNGIQYIRQGTGLSPKKFFADRMWTLFNQQVSVHQFMFTSQHGLLLDSYPLT